MKEGIDYRYVYKKDETPVERLRNKLSSVFTLLTVLSKLKHPEPLAGMIEKSNENLEDIRTLLDDAELCDC